MSDVGEQKTDVREQKTDVRRQVMHIKCLMLFFDIINLLFLYADEKTKSSALDSMHHDLPQGPRWPVSFLRPDSLHPRIPKPITCLPIDI